MRPLVAAQVPAGKEANGLLIFLFLLFHSLPFFFFSTFGLWIGCLNTFPLLGFVASRLSYCFGCFCRAMSVSTNDTLSVCMCVSRPIGALLSLVIIGLDIWPFTRTLPYFLVSFSILSSYVCIALLCSVSGRADREGGEYLRLGITCSPIRGRVGRTAVPLTCHRFGGHKKDSSQRSGGNRGFCDTGENWAGTTWAQLMVWTSK